MLFKLLSVLFFYTSVIPDGASLSQSFNPLSEFQDSIPAFSHGTGLIYIPNVQNISQCAYECLTIGKGDICNSFDYNKNEKICDLNVHVLSRDTKLKPSLDYVYHRRILDTHIQGDNEKCPQVIPCFCDHIGPKWKNYYIIQGDCISCTCKEMQNDTVCPMKKENCDCESYEFNLYKRDLNECMYCSCEIHEFLNHTDNVNYSHIQIEYLQLNTGGLGYISDSGDLWKRDSYYMGGIVQQFSNKTYLSNITLENEVYVNITNGTIETIVYKEVDIDYKYRSNRYSNSFFEYHIPISRDGDYILRLYFFQLEKSVNHFNIILSSNREHIVIDDRGLVVYEKTMRLFTPYVTVGFETVNIENDNFTSVPFVSAIEMVYLYPTYNIEFIEPYECHLPNCTCHVNQTVYFYQNISNTNINAIGPCYECSCIDIPVSIVEKIIIEPCPTYSTTTCPSITTTDVTTTTTDVTTTDVTTTSINYTESYISDKNTIASSHIITIVILSIVLLVFIILTILLFNENNKLKKKNRFLEEDSTRNSIKQEITSNYDNPLFVPSQYVVNSLQGSDYSA